MISATPCSMPGCRRSTKDVSGRCHDHRGGIRSFGSIPPPPSPPVVEVESPAYRPHTDYELDTDPRVERRGRYRVFFHRVLDGERGQTLELTFDEYGHLRIETWLKNGKLERPDGPAQIRRRPDGVREEVSYYRDDKLHRVGEPVVTHYDEHDLKVAEEYYRDGESHRINGPAMVSFGGGAPLRTKWYVRGRVVEGLAGVSAALEGWSHEALLAELPGIGDRGFTLADLSTPDLRTYLVASAYPDLLAEGLPAPSIVDAVRGGVTTPEGIREVIAGAPPEWVRSFESGKQG